MKWLFEKLTILWDAINQLVGNETSPWIPTVFVNGVASHVTWLSYLGRWATQVELGENQIVYQIESELATNPDLSLWWFFESRVILPANQTPVRLYVDKLVSYHIRGSNLKHSLRKLQKEDYSRTIYNEIRSILEQCQSYEWYGEYEIELAVEDQQTGFEVAFVVTLPVFAENIIF